jgi:dCMP deaminase
MFVGLCGGICAGKHTVAQYLVDHHGFKELHLQQAPSNPSTDEHTFQTVLDLVDFVTKRWRERWVTTDIYNESILDILVRRPFFILISVDAPVSVRWKRFQKKLNTSDPTSSAPLSSPSKDLSLEEFLFRSDEHLYSSTSGLLPLISRATVRLLNTSSDLAHLYASLGKLDLTNEDRLRPSWDQYFMELASLAAQRSNCMKRRVGCVLVRQKRVISTGYNGTPRGLKNCGEGGCPRCNEGQGSGVGLGTCLCIHAEENALLEAGRERIREGAILYCDTCPCLTCSIKITQVGISEVVYSQSYSMDGETAAVFKEAGVHLRQFSPVSATYPSKTYANYVFYSLPMVWSILRSKRSDNLVKPKT